MTTTLIKACTGAAGAAVLVVFPGSHATRAAPPIDPGELETLAPEAGVELTEEQAESLFDTLQGVTGDAGGSSSLTGPCGGVAFSYDSDGALIDAAYDAGDGNPPIDLLDGSQAFTDGNRYQVDTNGSVSYFGFAPRDDEGPMDYSYELKVAGITVASADEENSAGNNRNGGVIDMASESPFAFDANVDASGKLTIGETEYCAGEGKIEFVGDGIASVPGLVGIGLLGIGVLGVFINARPARTWKA